jgi:hypothetical protein
MDQPNSQPRESNSQAREPTSVDAAAPTHSRRRLLAAAGGLAAGVVMTPGMAAGSTSRPEPAHRVGYPIDDTGAVTTATGRFVDYREWNTPREFTRGRIDGLRLHRGGGLELAAHARGLTTYVDPFAGPDAPERSYRTGTWTSSWITTEHAVSEAVASWNAVTPTGSWLQIELRGRASATATATKWFVLGRWTAGDDFAAGDIHRTSVDGQGDDDATVYTDTFATRDGKAVVGYQLRVSLLAPTGSHVTPRLDRIGVMSSFLPDEPTVDAGAYPLGQQVLVETPQYSQNVHEGEYPEYDGGGEAWCSPTSTSMVVYRWGERVPAADLAWVTAPNGDPQVDYAARYAYDYTYEGAGNWPFNTAYAAGFGLSAHVTRLTSLDAVLRYVRAGIPVVVSVRFTKAELPEAGYATNGHLLVIVGFTATGDVIVNDPASADDAAVRRVYPRAKFANVWLPSTKSGGVAYVIQPPGGHAH